jgi:hypothetical protein
METYSSIKENLKFLENQINLFNKIVFHEDPSGIDLVIFQTSYLKLINYDRTKNDLVSFLEEQIEQNNELILVNINNKLNTIISKLIFTIKKYEELEYKEQFALYEYYKKLVDFFHKNIYNDLTFSVSEFYSICSNIIRTISESSTKKDIKPFTQKNDIVIFNKWIVQYKDNKGFSYFYYRIKDNLINCTQKEFIEQLYRNKYINESQFNYYILNFVTSLKNCKSQSREDYYNLLKENN